MDIARLTYLLLLSFGWTICSSAQGVDRVFVESVPISAIEGAEECMADSGLYLHRLFVDLEEGYRLQAIFGSEGQPLIISSPTGFEATDNASLLVDLDGFDGLCDLLTSRLTVGVTVKGHLGFPLQSAVNADLKAEKVSLAELLGTPDTTTVILSSFGLDPRSLVGDISGLRTENGAWAAFGGVSGAGKENVVLIAHLLSTSPITYELNLQLADMDGNTYTHLARGAQDDDTRTHYSLKNTGPDGP